MGEYFAQLGFMVNKGRRRELIDNEFLHHQPIPRHRSGRALLTHPALALSQTRSRSLGCGWTIRIEGIHWRMRVCIFCQFSRTAF